MADEGNEENGTGDEGAGENQNADEGNQNDGGSGDGGKQGEQENWYGDDWRQQLAGDDDAFLKQLGRYNTPNDFATGHKALQQKFSSGEARGELPEKYTDEELATWREANGVPEKAEGYFTDMPDGLVIGDEDKELFSDFGQVMHDLNVKPEVTNGVAAWYYDMQEKEQAAQAETDENQRMATEDALNVLWKDDYRSTINTLDAYLEQAPESVSDFLSNARVADGTPLMTKPEVLEWLAGKARDENPFVTPVPNQGDMTSIVEEKAALITASGNLSGPYYKGPKEANGETVMYNRLMAINKHEARQKDAAA